MSPTHSAMSSDAYKSVANSLRVLVVYDGPLAQQRVEKMLARIRGRFSGKLRFDSTFRCTDEVLNPLEPTDATLVELLILATECSAALSLESLCRLAGLLAALKVNDGALALLTGDNVPRQMDTLLLERCLGVHAERRGVPFIRGRLTRLGCPGCTVTLAKPARGRSGSPPQRRDRNDSPANSFRIEKQVVSCTTRRAARGFVRKMIALYRAQSPYQLPDEFRTRLHQSIAQHWMEKQKSGDVRGYIKPARCSIQHALSFSRQQR